MDDNVDNHTDIRNGLVIAIGPRREIYSRVRSISHGIKKSLEYREQRLGRLGIAYSSSLRNAIDVLFVCHYFLP
jgi:hypothetical protein